ncbi:VOC family protein [Rubrivivax gelatinosus]|uniref:Glyoxalase n=1 Tax=Rubrivivax gelatinosus TaxID=28068 RepID=A0ABS1DQ41_RUBGE|nr:VOC family protein [Rubrivivax gelatinosus]MBK1712123.1 glyoxalase [Rubrivivax gelatinosus]
MPLAYTILYVEDVARSLAFYRSAFGLALKLQHEGGDYGELDTGSTTLAFSSRRLLAQLGHQAQAPQADAPCFEIAFTTDDVAATLQQALAAGARGVQEPQQMPWGQTVAYVADPDGFRVEICTPIQA